MRCSLDHAPREAEKVERPWPPQPLRLLQPCKQHTHYPLQICYNYPKVHMTTYLQNLMQNLSYLFTWSQLFITNIEKNSNLHKRIRVYTSSEFSNRSIFHPFSDSLVNNVYIDVDSII